MVLQYGIVYQLAPAGLAFPRYYRSHAAHDGTTPCFDASSRWDPLAARPVLVGGVDTDGGGFRVKVQHQPMNSWTGTEPGVAGFLAHFQIRRDGRRRGIVEVVT